LLVELHHLLVQLLPIVAVLVLKLLELGLQLLHGEHRARALERERQEHEHHREGEQRDRARVAGPQLVVELQRSGNDVVHQATVRSWRWSGRGSADRSCPRRSGTGSKPWPPQGLQRQMRRTANQLPLAAPCTSSASTAYSEQEGK